VRIRGTEKTVKQIDAIKQSDKISIMPQGNKLQIVGFSSTTWSIKIKPSGLESLQQAPSILRAINSVK